MEDSQRSRPWLPAFDRSHRRGRRRPGRFSGASDFRTPLGRPPVLLNERAQHRSRIRVQILRFQQIPKHRAHDRHRRGVVELLPDIGRIRLSERVQDNALLAMSSSLSVCPPQTIPSKRPRLRDRRWESPSLPRIHCSQAPWTRSCYRESENHRRIGDIAIRSRDRQ